MLKKILIIFLFPLSAVAEINLTPIQEHNILQGHTCCYADDVIENVKLKYQIYQEPEFKFKVPMYVPQNYWEEPVDRWVWVMFWGIQLADIYSTHKGVKYDCIKEANPLLPSVPTIAEMATLKGVVLLPTYGAIGYENITRGELVAPLLLGGFVVHNNIKLTKRAEKRCNLR